MPIEESTFIGAATIALDDPGHGRRLDAARRTSLRASLRDATRSGAPTVLVRVAGDAWAHRARPDDPVDAERITRDQHALVRAVHDAAFPVVVHVAGEVSELGLTLLLAADVRLVAADAVVSFDAGSAAVLLTSGVPSLMQHRTALADLLWTGGRLNAQESVGRGVATEVCDVERAAELASSLASAPHGTSALRRSLRADTAADLAERLEYAAWLAVVAARDQR